LIVDEASMIDTLLMYHLVQAIPAEATIILVGDINQLPSVGPGTVLKDMIAAGIAPVVELREVFRQAQESRIVTNAHKVNSGQLPVMQKAGAQLSDFYFIEKENPDEALQLIIDLVTDHIPRRFGFDALRDIQVLTPMNKGITGVENLNHALQQSLNPQGEVIARRPYTFRINDRVMQIRNNYEKEVFNGDIGCIRGFDSDTQEITVAYDDCTVTYDTADMDELILAYAITIHKAQGSEYPAVVIPILSQHHLLLQRNLLYTAITRGRRLVVIVGSKQALAYGVQNDTPRRRYTGLARRLAATKECKQTDGGDSIDI
ncbi:MAG TPA: AAA family ATPase, partial [Thermodesulfobacteriota bacterium]|nr:AAA family ATPase [Thermodesulfobacteriota bacterium]